MRRSPLAARRLDRPEDDPLRPTASRVVGRRASRRRRATRAPGVPAPDREGLPEGRRRREGPVVQAQLIRYLNQQLLKKLHLRRPRRGPQRVLELVEGGPFVGPGGSAGSTALPLRAKNSRSTEGDHADCLEALGGARGLRRRGAHSIWQGTTSALRTCSPRRRRGPRPPRSRPCSGPCRCGREAGRLESAGAGLAASVETDAYAAAPSSPRLAGQGGRAPPCGTRERRIAAREAGRGRARRRAAAARGDAVVPPAPRAVLRRPQKRSRPSPADVVAAAGREPDASERTLVARTVRSTHAIGDDAGVARWRRRAWILRGAPRTTTSHEPAPQRPGAPALRRRRMNSAPLISVPAARRHRRRRSDGVEADQCRNGGSVFVPPTPRIRRRRRSPVGARPASRRSTAPAKPADASPAAARRRVGLRGRRWRRRRARRADRGRRPCVPTSRTAAARRGGAVARPRGGRAATARRQPRRAATRAHALASTASRDGRSRRARSTIDAARVLRSSGERARAAARRAPSEAPRAR